MAKLVVLVAWVPGAFRAVDALSAAAASLALAWAALAVAVAALAAEALASVLTSLATALVCVTKLASEATQAKALALNVLLLSDGVGASGSGLMVVI
jgi:hypothetical protein